MTTAGSTPASPADVNGVRIHWDAFGDPADPALLLIMGLATQMIAWDEQFCEMLAARGFRVIRFDNRDVGLSSRLDALGLPDVGAMFQKALAGQPVTAPYTLRDMALDVIGLMDALGIERAHVVGASMGGAIGQELAIHHAARVRSLTSIMSTSGKPGLPMGRPDAVALLFTPTPIDRDGYCARQVQVARLLRGPGFPEDEARDAARAVRSFERGPSPAGAVRQLSATLASGDRTPGLRQVAVPTLVIHGDADPLLPHAHGVDVANAVANASLLTVPGMGHSLPISAWPGIVDAIARHASAAVAR